MEDVCAGSMKYFYIMCAGIPILMIFPQIITVFTH
jgi:hypothetical protein